MNIQNINYLTQILDYYSSKVNDTDKNSMPQLKNSINADLERITKLTDDIGTYIINLFTGIGDPQNEVKNMISCFKLQKALKQIKTDLELEESHPLRSLIIKINESLETLSMWMIIYSETILQSTKMPISYGHTLEKIEQAIKDKITLKDSHQLDDMQKLVFHFFADQEDPLFVKKLDSKWNGLPPFYSYLSLLEILSSCLNTSTPPDPALVKMVKEIEKTKSILNKMYVITDIFIEQNKRNICVKGTGYYQSLIDSKWFSSPNNENPPSQTQISYPYEGNCRIPLSVLIQDVTYDIINHIKSLQIGERAFFPLGSSNHSILIEIAREKENSYTYKIYNTGEGVLAFHQTVNDGSLKALPIVIKDLPIEAFSYGFIGTLVKSSSTVYCNVENLYTFHKGTFVDQFHKIWDGVSGNPYSIQTQGTCSFQSWEACLSSTLSPSTLEKIELAKAKLSVERQCFIHTLLNNKKRRYESSTKPENNSQLMSKKQKLNSSIEQSSLLLDMSLRHLLKAKSKLARHAQKS